MYCPPLEIKWKAALVPLQGLFPLTLARKPLVEPQGHQLEKQVCQVDLGNWYCKLLRITKPSVPLIREVALQSIFLLFLAELSLLASQPATLGIFSWRWYNFSGAVQSTEGEKEHNLLACYMGLVKAQDCIHQSQHSSSWFYIRNGCSMVHKWWQDAAGYTKAWSGSVWAF